MASSLSVIMSNYNHAHYIRDALSAILNQSLRPKEVIVIDDGSTDDSVSVIERIAKRDPMVQFLRNDRNYGALFTVNRALNLTSGDYVYSASADDKILPGFFEKSMALLEKYPQAGLCCSDPATFNDKLEMITNNKLRWAKESCYFSRDDFCSLIKGGYIAGHTSLVKRQALTEAGGYLPGLKWHCDWFASLVIAFRHGVCYIPESLATLRVGIPSYSSGRSKWLDQESVLCYLIKLLKSPEYQDIFPFFKRGNVLAHFGSEIVRTVLENPQHWDLASFNLIGRQFLMAAKALPKRAVSLMTPAPIKQWYRFIRDGANG